MTGTTYLLSRAVFAVAHMFMWCFLYQLSQCHPAMILMPALSVVSETANSETAQSATHGPAFLVIASAIFCF